MTCDDGFNPVGGLPCVLWRGHESPHRDAKGGAFHGEDKEQHSQRKPAVRAASYLTQPQLYRLNLACRDINTAFGCPPYLVGSVLFRPDYRDIDLRLPMMESRGGTDFQTAGARLTLINCALSDWVAAITGLPIDFQFQDEAEWASYDGELRNPMGVGE